MYFGEATNPAFIVAAHSGCKEIVELLIASGANVHTVDFNGQTPLHVASMEGHREVVEILIASGAQINAETKDGCTPLYMAALGQHQDIVQLLLDCGAVIEPDIGVMLGDIELVKRYLEEGVDVNSKLAKGLTKGDSWLTTAIGYKYRNKNLIEFLLSSGARVNEKTGYSEFSPLHKAAIVGCTDTCKVLIDYGADVNSTDKVGDTPLHKASQLEHDTIVKLLLNYGANVNALNLTKRSALFEAARLHRQQVVESLLSHNAEVNLRDNLGFTPLLYAFQRKGGEEIIKILLTNGADANVRFPQGAKSSPLLMAIAQKNKNLVELLLAYGVQEGLE